MEGSIPITNTHISILIAEKFITGLFLPRSPIKSVLNTELHGDIAYLGIGMPWLEARDQPDLAPGLSATDKKKIGDVFFYF